MIDTGIIIPPNASLFEALERMESEERRLLIICKPDMHFVGVLSVGDIQRAVLNKADLTEAVDKFIRSDILYAHITDDIHRIKEKMISLRIESMPIVDENNRLVDVVEWNDANPVVSLGVKEKLCPVVIMAGGKGTRLRPLTNIIPKPLLPVSDRTIIDEIIERFLRYGCEEYYISVNYKADAIKQHFKEKIRDYYVQIVEEKMNMGTAGALYFLKNTIKETFLLSNCDVVTDLNLDDLMNYHKRMGNKMTIVSVLEKESSPYGIIETENDGKLKFIREKPRGVHQINAGIYVIEPEVLRFFSGEERYDMPDLIKELQEHGEQIGVFPVPKNQWVDLGSWSGYLTYCNIVQV